MEVRNCKGCGKIFNYMGGAPLCTTCAKKLEEKFDLVKAYLYDHPGAGIQEISDEFEVSVNQIHKWIREERLAFAEDSLIGIACEGCGADIKTGRFCKSCKDKLANNLSNVYKEPEVKLKPKQDANARMRFLE